LQLDINFHKCLIYHIYIINYNIHLPINDKNLQLFPNNGNDLGPGNSEYSLANSTSSCDILVRTDVDFLARQVAILKFHNCLANTDILLFILRPVNEQLRTYIINSSLRVY